MDLDQRIVFHEGDRILEIDLTDLVLADSRDVARLYDRLESRVAEEGGRWFFLVNYLNCHIHPEAWVEFARRGKRFNLASSLGTMRFNTAEELGDEIRRRATDEKFQPNLAGNREAALRRLAAIREAYARDHPARAPLAPEFAAEFERRIAFLPDQQVMEADFSNFHFTDAAMVDAFYDAIEQKIGASGRTRWYFLVNLGGCEIHPEAWIAYANRGKRLNQAHSLGSVRYDASRHVAADILTHAAVASFDPNLFESRAAALAALGTMRAKAATPMTEDPPYPVLPPREE